MRKLLLRLSLSRSRLAIGMVVGVACLIAAVAVASSGGDDGDAAQGSEIDYSWADEAPKAFAERLARLLETSRKGDCAELDAISARSTTALTCPPDRSLARSMAKFRVLGSEEHGTGAIVDYKSGAVTDSAAIVLVVGPGRAWGVSRFGVFTKPSVGTSDERSRAGFDKAVDDYLRAVRDRDCRSLARLEFALPGADRASCKQRLTETSALAKRMKANPAAEATYAGGNATFGFYALETAKPQPLRVTIATMREAAGNGNGAADSYRVLDVVPSPTAAEQRRAREGLERSERRRRSQ